ncbi:MAG TPA: energy transducer TonB [Spongiibacteraceae bacterium]|nr:energy transducer TonB [Spongiibacteraceae bacterium]
MINFFKIANVMILSCKIGLVGRFMFVLLTAVLSACQAQPSKKHVAANPQSVDAPASSDQEQGVILALFVLADGSVGDAKIEKGSGYPSFDRATLDYYRKSAKFLPATKDGKPIDAWKILKVIPKF